MDPTIPYLACVVGAAALYFLLRPGPRAAKAIAALVGLGIFAWMLVEAANHVGASDHQAGGQSGRPEVFFTIFSLIALASAVRMITHPRPVYSALYFVMVVLSSAALFLLLQAEFMAFALVIVYAGAILITYMFVLMLAQQAPNPDDANAQPEYDVLPREPMAAVVVGFIMLALFTNMIFGGTSKLPAPPTAQEAQAMNWQKLDMMPGELNAVLQKIAPRTQLLPDSHVQFDGKTAYVMVEPQIGSLIVAPMRVDLPPDALPSNVQLVGLDLVAKFPVSLELAGVILLMAMFGAVVLARKQIELGEDEVREAAGMRRLDFHADEPGFTEPRSRPAGAGGGGGR